MKIWALFIIICLPAITGWGQSTNSIDTSFESHKGRLPFPVDRYCKLHTYEEFLKESHKRMTSGYPTYSLTILSDSIMDVKSPVAGVIGSVFIVDGKMVLFVKHGDYAFMYVNLDTVFVKKGDPVLSRQLIGRVNNFNNDQLYELELLLTNKQGRDIDPYPWFIDSKRLVKK
jgi:hypothetical protein